MPCWIHYGRTLARVTAIQADNDLVTFGVPRASQGMHVNDGITGLPLGHGEKPIRRVAIVLSYEYAAAPAWTNTT
jgi:hypothetical protein